ncbi:MAG: S8 family serine peptidase, partial [Bacteroidetes bacterium]|nr:S8 family serine peptidase [Bacteroidota bacterium]
MKNPTGIRLAFLLLASYLCLALHAQTEPAYDPHKIRVKFSPITKQIVKQQIATLQNKRIGQQRIGLLSIDYLNQLHGAEKMRQLFKTHLPKHQQLHAQFGLDAWFEITLNAKVTPAMLEAYNSNQHILIAEPVYKKRLVDGFTNAAPQFISDDPDFSDQWHYENNGQTGGTIDADIDLQDAWDIEMGDSNIIVAIIDGGIDISHEDLWQAVWINKAEYHGISGVDDDGNGYVDDIHGFNFVENVGAVVADNHATHVAGTVGAMNNNGIGVSGIAGGSGNSGGVKLMSCQTFGENNNDGFAEALVYAADNGAVIAQNSWGYESPGVYEQSVLDAIDYFIAHAGTDGSGNQNGPMKGGIVIFAAGNDNENNEWYPAYYNKVLAVASTNHNDRKAHYSNFGSWVDIAAPGGETDYLQEGVLSTLQSNNYGYLQGTSMACPHVSGVAALIISHFQEAGFEANDVWDRLIYASDYIDDINPMYNGLMGSGRLNALNALLVDDGIPPAAINDLSVIDESTTGLVLEWTSTGGSGNIGKSVNYDIRYAQYPIDSSGFFDAQQVYGEPQPTPAGSIQQFEINGLAAGTTYYIAMKAVDGFGNTSGISNIASGTTQDAPEIQITPKQLTVNTGEGHSTMTALNIANIGNATLEFSFSDGQHAQNIPIHHSSRLPFNKPVTKRMDERIGQPVQKGTGSDGPGGFGYRWADNHETNGPVFQWEDISSGGTALNLDDDDYAVESLPFEFPFYGTKQSHVYISSNGFLTFTASDAQEYNNQQLPNTEIPNNLIAAFWDDLNPGKGGHIYYQEFSNKCIVQYSNVPRYGNESDHYTFQIILYPSGDIKLQYQSIDGDHGSCTVGIENAEGTEGMQILFNTDYLADEHAIYITSQEFIADISPMNGDIEIEENQNINITIDASELNPGHYYEEIYLMSNDPQNDMVTIPVYLSVMDCMEDTTFITDSICEGESYYAGDSVFTESGHYAVVMSSMHGCDSLVHVDLTVHPVPVTEITASICEGESYYAGDSVFTESGDYEVVMSSMHGCDSLLHVDLTVHPVPVTEISASICEGASYYAGDSVFTESGDYEVVMSSMHGCDSLVHVDLTVHPVPVTEITASICEGESYYAGDSVFTESGDYEVVMSSMHGCDSLVHVDLTVHPVPVTEITASICDGENYYAGDSVFTESGHYAVVMSSMHGCDSLVHVDLTVHPVPVTEISASICDGENYYAGDSVFTESGDYEVVMSSMHGCDSLVHVDLTVHPVPVTEISASICGGESYYAGDSVFTESGDYEVVMSSMHGCDSL